MRTLLALSLLLAVGCSAPPLRELVPEEFVAHVPQDDEPGYTYMSGRTMGGRIFYPKHLEQFETGFRTAGGKVVREGEQLTVKAALVYDAELPAIQHAVMTLRFTRPLPEDGEARWNQIHAALERAPLELIELELPADGIALEGRFTRPWSEVPAEEDAAAALVSVLFRDAEGIVVLEVLPIPIEPAGE